MTFYVLFAHFYSQTWRANKKNCSRLKTWELRVVPTRAFCVPITFHFHDKNIIFPPTTTTMANPARAFHRVFTGYWDTELFGLPVCFFAYRLLTWFVGVSTRNTGYLLGLFFARHKIPGTLLVCGYQTQWGSGLHSALNKGLLKGKSDILGIKKPSFLTPQTRYFAYRKLTGFVGVGKINTGYEFFRSFDFYILSPCFFRVKRPDKMLQISTHHPHRFDDGLLLIAQPPHFTSSLTTLPSSSLLFPSVKFTVCGECRIYFRHRSICNISRNWNSPPKSSSIVMLQWRRALKLITIRPALELHVGLTMWPTFWQENGGLLGHLCRWCIGCQVSWCTCKMSLFMFYTKLTNPPNNPHRRDAKIHVEMWFNDWRYQLRSSRKNKVFGLCKSCKKMLFRTWSTQQSTRGWHNNSALWW
jgi:hypothetical protein